MLNRNPGHELSLRVVLFHQALADRLGINITDHKCLGILHEEGAIPAGRLAELTGLTTGAITAVIDRLERAGFVCREKDPKDRRRVIIQPNMEKAKNEIQPLMEPMIQEMSQLMSSFNQQELEAISRYIDKTIHILEQAASKLQKAKNTSRDK
ncbi:MarR family winged helix-turn-helix transcriptional regulator [Thermoflavimicrobium daqui]|uniref:MarR family transcriptional regulator n=1 Tax=Thermoflavimicrobium daqui TaxID=2137476 RepID=A0A364K7W6_9BACL|nr:MarR family transcriptional regulator [Thermoflavimicrobium daqui]RAL26383.1 MarR family transcriptional regulator [Thermoflavimicrobium daqui]